MALIPSGYRWRMFPTTVAGHVFAQSHIPYESAPTGYGRGQTDVPSYTARATTAFVGSLLKTD